jgi:hypothetical protein
VIVAKCLIIRCSILELLCSMSEHIEINDLGGLCHILFYYGTIGICGGGRGEGIVWD